MLSTHLFNPATKLITEVPVPSREIELSWYKSG